MLNINQTKEKRKTLHATLDAFLTQENGCTCSGEFPKEIVFKQFGDISPTKSSKLSTKL